MWYAGKLTGCDLGKWHVEFEDGDRDTYNLPHRSNLPLPPRPPPRVLCHPRSRGADDCAKMHGPGVVAGP